jgi:hypothetical protein
MNQESNPDEPPRSPNAKTDLAPGSSGRSQLPAIAWTLLIVPPVTTVLTFGLGLFIDSLQLGPKGFLCVLILIGPGSFAVGGSIAVGIARYLSNGSILLLVCIVAVEVTAIVVVYPQLTPTLGAGWG